MEHGSELMRVIMIVTRLLSRVLVVPILFGRLSVFIAPAVICAPVLITYFDTKVQATSFCSLEMSEVPFKYIRRTRKRYIHPIVYRERRT